MNTILSIKYQTLLNLVLFVLSIQTCYICLKWFISCNRLIVILVSVKQGKRYYWWVIPNLINPLCMALLLGGRAYWIKTLVEELKTYDSVVLNEPKAPISVKQILDKTVKNIENIPAAGLSRACPHSEFTQIIAHAI